MKNNGYGIITELERVIPKVSFTGCASLSNIVSSVRGMMTNTDSWKAALLALECLDQVTDCRNAVIHRAKCVAMCATMCKIVCDKVDHGNSIYYRDWKSVAYASGIKVPKSISCVQAGPVPPRVIADVLKSARTDGRIEFDGDSGHPVILKFSTIIDCMKHGSTYAITLRTGYTKPILVFESAGNVFILVVPTISVGGHTMLDVANEMLCATGTDCTRMHHLVTSKIITTFDTMKFAFYPSDDMATLRDNFPRSPVKMIKPAYYDSMISGMRKALDKCAGRGYAFYGKPGCGKSLLIQKIAWDLREYPLIILPAARMLTADYRLDELADYITTLMRIHPKVVFTMDDIDGCEIRDKNIAATKLIAFLDRIKECAEYTGASYLFLATLNNPKEITDTIVARSGRVDELLEICLPDASTIASYMHTEFGVFTDAIDKMLFNTMVEHEFSMADVKNCMHSWLYTGRKLKDSVDLIAKMKSAVK